jgi:hypothetical protein
MCNFAFGISFDLFPSRTLLPFWHSDAETDFFSKSLIWNGDYLGVVDLIVMKIKLLKLLG